MKLLFGYTISFPSVTERVTTEPHFCNKSVSEYFLQSAQMLINSGAPKIFLKGISIVIFKNGKNDSEMYILRKQIYLEGIFIRGVDGFSVI